MLNFSLFHMEVVSILQFFRKKNTTTNKQRQHPSPKYIKLKYLLSPSSFFILILIIAHDLKLSRICKSLFVFPSFIKILHDTFW